MIIIKNTPGLAGVTICGDYNDLYHLVEAFHEITINEDSQTHRKYHQYFGISIRVLGVCYDIRHAYQGDREVELIDNDMTEHKMKWHSIIAPNKNVYYSCNVLYPEIFLVMLALNALIKLRVKSLTKAKSIPREFADARVAWDKTIATIRIFQAALAECVRQTLTKATFTRWVNVMSNDHTDIKNIMGQYVDLLNIRHINMSKEKRMKNLSPVAKRIAEFNYNKDHREIKDVVTRAAEEYKCEPGAIRLRGIEYPEDFVW